MIPRTEGLLNSVWLAAACGGRSECLWDLALSLRWRMAVRELRGEAMVKLPRVL